MKTAISIPDEVYKKAEKLAKRQRKSRSRLYSDAVADYVARHDEDSITERINAVIAEFGHEPSKFVNEAARRTLERSEW